MANIGDTITFTYPVGKGSKTNAHDPRPKVFVLHPNWQGNLHALKTDLMSPNEWNMLRMIIDPVFQKEHKAALTRQDPNLVREFDAIMESASSATVTSPYDFYKRAIKPFLTTRRDRDPYRQYSVSKMTGVRTTVSYQQMLQATADASQSQSLWQKFRGMFSGMRGPKLPTRFR